MIPGPATLLVTLAGDRTATEAVVDASVPLTALLETWGPVCSNHPARELVAVSADGAVLYDPSESLAGLGVEPGSVLHVMTATEAMRILGADEVPADPRPAPTLVRPMAYRQMELRPGEAPAAFPAGPVPGPGGFAVPPPPPDPSADPVTPPGPAPALPRRVNPVRRVGLAVRAVLSRPATAAPEGTYAKDAAPGPAARYRQSLRGTNRVANLEVLVRSAPLRRCVVVSVVSPKGGVGKTTVTALLGMLLAELRRDAVLALDANPDYGNLKDKLAPPNLQPVAAVDELAGWLATHPEATSAEVAPMLGVGPHGLRFVPTPVGDIDRMVHAADFALYRDLLARLRTFQGVVVVDCGTGLLDPPVRAAIEAADQFLLVTDSAPDSAKLVVAAARRLPPGTPTWLVANKMPVRGSELDLDKVAAAIPGLRGMTVLPERRLAENVVTPRFTWDQCPPVWREPLREIAAHLANSWRTLP